MNNFSRNSHDGSHFLFRISVYLNKASRMCFLRIFGYSTGNRNKLCKVNKSSVWLNPPPPFPRGNLIITLIHTGDGGHILLFTAVPQASETHWADCGPRSTYSSGRVRQSWSARLDFADRTFVGTMTAAVTNRFTMSLRRLLADEDVSKNFSFSFS